MPKPCPKCGKEIYEGCKICPECKQDISSYLHESGQTFHFENASYSKPDKPNKTLLIICAVLVLLSIAIFKFSAWVYPSSGWLLIAIVGAIVLIVGLLCIKAHVQLVKEYKLSITDNKAFQELREQQGRQIDEWTKETERKAAEKTAVKYNHYKYKCPMCGSNKIITISTVKKSVSVTAVGLASGMIGKNYECDDCKYKW